MARKWPLIRVVAITIFPCVVACVFASVLFRTKVDRAPHLSDWTLETEQGASQAVHLPVHLQGLLGPREQTFRLSRELSVDIDRPDDVALGKLRRVDFGGSSESSHPGR